MDERLGTLAADYWHALCLAYPLSASHVGEHDYDELVPDLRAARQAEQAARLRELAGAAEQLVAGDGLSAADRVTAELLAFEATAYADGLVEAAEEYTVAPAITGPLVAVFETCPRLVVTDSAHATALVVRYRRLAGMFDTATQRVIDGTTRGLTPPAHMVAATISWLDRYLASDLTTDPLLQPQPPPEWRAEQVATWREALRHVVASSVRPALARYRDRLADDVLPRARPMDQVGLCWIPEGQARYASAIRRHTSRDLVPDELHEIGLAEIERLGEEYRTIGAGVLGTTDLAEIYRRLRDDPALRFDTSEEVQAAAEAALARAEAAVPDWFGRLPDTPCVVLPMDPHEVEHSTIAYYQPPAAHGTRPGSYYVNTYAPHTRTRFEAEALAFHEAVPGHHTQIALAQELDLPTFRRHAIVNAYTEGWALYTERLADEMGLYSSEVARLGMLAFDSWRAGRLVVDTGLHHYGWSREQAIDFFLEHSPLAENNITNEVDRYIVLPGQALGYKVGQREIVALRTKAERRLGGRFDLSGFHDAILEHGSIHLDLLDDLIERWITAHTDQGA